MKQAKFTLKDEFKIESDDEMHILSYQTINNSENIANPTVSDLRFYVKSTLSLNLLNHVIEGFYDVK